MMVARIAALSLAGTGGKTAGVVLAETLPSPQDMQKIARDGGYSETVFAQRQGDGWHVRYYTP